ncbi:hypothetical protein C5167_004078 [Papaver somniferum]|uniref:uncharacterized protein LOC113332374 n=1 Tax=Papaver somniferum TaxID=3469 RepID=UPI000E703729|nr:uncharacterized protein LOC113332374 [Papaver somniferum]RZC87898.1 hypothetical protein C5167_004078 [Papaver somniferum]
MLTFIDLVFWILILMSLTHEELIQGKIIQNVVNKSIIKTIKVETDEIIDCYDIYRQPSLSHPLLCNHTIQMAPSSHPKGMKSDNFGTYQLTQTWHNYGICPEGTIPIRRKVKNYDPTLSRKHIPLKFSPYKTNVTSQDDVDRGHGHEYTTIEVGGNFLGAQAKINLWQPVTEIYDEMSTSQIWVKAGPDTIETGWQVSRKLHGDDYTRFFISWTNDGYKSSGCYDLICDGFVHISSIIGLGCNFTEVSTFNGSQKDATFSIHKDQSRGHWWVQLQGIFVGYYPSILFTELSKRATRVIWGGEITNWKSKGRHTSTQMGSGHFPSEGGLETSSYFNWVQVVNENFMAKDPENIVIQVTNPDCYGLKIDDDKYGTNGYGFYYGGPGYNDKCQ